MAKNNVTVKFKKIDNRAVIPSYAHNGDVGMDMTAISMEYDKTNDIYIYHTGLAVETDKGYGMFLFPRSSNRKTDAYLCNHVGIVDCAIYRGEIMFCYKNRDSLNLWQKILGVKPINKAPYKIGDRIGQMVILPYPNVSIEIVDSLSETERGEQGFGSTGN